jgi:outer membrane protein assembly factor BamB
VREFSGAQKTFKSSNMPYWITLIDVVNGQDVWTTETLGFKDHYGYFLSPEIGGMLVYAKDKNKKKTVFAVEIGTGHVRWESRDFYVGEPAGFRAPLFDSKESMITFTKKKAIRKFNAKTGQLIWETEINAKKGSWPTLVDEDRGVVYRASNKHLYALHTNDGNLVWEKAPKFKNQVSGMQLIPQGLLIKGGSGLNLLDPASGQVLWKKWYKKGTQIVVTGEGLVVKGSHINLLDPATGEPLWKKPFKKLNDATNLVIKDDKVIVCADKKLYAINLSDGAYAEIAKDLKFEGKEIARFMMLRDDGLFFQSSNNLMLVSFNGEKLFHTYHKAPGLSFAEKMAAKAAGKVMEKTTGYFHARGWETDYEEADRLLDYWAPVVYSDQKSLDSYLWGKRFKSTKNLETYTYILTNIKTDTQKGVGLVKVNKVNGATENQIIIGKKNPDYEIDEIESRLFFKSGKKEIVCYKF